jgi:hypothetical protein
MLMERTSVAHQAHLQAMINKRPEESEDLKEFDPIVSK